MLSVDDLNQSKVFEIFHPFLTEKEKNLISNQKSLNFIVVHHKKDSSPFEINFTQS